MKVILKRNKLYFDEYFYIDLNRDTIIEYDLKNRDEISEEEYYSLIKKRAYSMAYYLLAKRDISTKKLKDKLIEKYHEKDIIENLIVDFTNKGYLDDYEFARIYIKNHNYSKKKMEYMLFLQGIEKDIIQDLLSNYDEKDREEIKKLWIKLGNRDEQKKIMSLMRKGYNYAMIKEVIKEI